MKHGSEICAVYVRLVGKIRKRPVPIVMIEKILTILCDIQIRPTVIIVVAPHAAKTKAGSGNSRGLSNVRKCSVPIVAIKSVTSGNASAVEVSSADEINIGPAVAIVVSDARSEEHTSELQS